MTTEERNQLIIENLPVIARMAINLRSRMPRHASQTVDDLVGYGVQGLIDSIKSFDGRCKLMTYAKRRVVGAMLDGIRKEDWVPRVARKREGEAARCMFIMSQLSPDEVQTYKEDGHYENVDLAVSTPSEQSLNSDLNETLEDLCRGFSDREVLVCRRFFAEDATQEEIGRDIGISGSGVAQMITRIVGPHHRSPSRGPQSWSFASSQK